eukprot:scaffold537_cov241-Pinguiococcus_pyrenoidosus.AAC.23
MVLREVHVAKRATLGRPHGLHRAVARGVGRKPRAVAGKAERRSAWPRLARRPVSTAGLQRFVRAEATPPPGRSARSGARGHAVYVQGGWHCWRGRCACCGELVRGNVSNTGTKPARSAPLAGPDASGGAAASRDTVREASRRRRDAGARALSSAGSGFGRERTETSRECGGTRFCASRLAGAPTGRQLRFGLLTRCRACVGGAASESWPAMAQAHWPNPGDLQLKKLLDFTAAETLSLTSERSCTASTLWPIPREPANPAQGGLEEACPSPQAARLCDSCGCRLLEHRASSPCPWRRLSAAVGRQTCDDGRETDQWLGRVQIRSATNQPPKLTLQL